MPGSDSNSEEEEEEIPCCTTKEEKECKKLHLYQYHDGNYYRAGQKLNIYDRPSSRVVTKPTMSDNEPMSLDHPPPLLRTPDSRNRDGSNPYQDGPLIVDLCDYN